MMKETENASRRLKMTANHLQSSSSSSENLSVEPTSFEKSRVKVVSNQRGHHQGREEVKWNGWGYNDTKFELNNKNQIYLTGKRYELCGVPFPKLRPWAEESFGLSVDQKSPPNEKIQDMPPAIKVEAFLKEIEGKYFKISFQERDRLNHGHGHTCDDIWKLRYGKFERLPDAVVWPDNHGQVEELVAAAAKHNVVLIPFGGGTSVSSGLECPDDEKRMVVSVDMHEMNRIKWIDHDSRMACIESGIVGKDLDAKLAKLGLCVGHEPDSSEFSTLGGWVATRASGMKKNVYGNIEDILISCKMVTPRGTIEKGCSVPRISTGPDVNQIILGSEGTLGIVTECVLRLRPLPEVRAYGSIAFPDFESGVACLHEISRQRLAPASIRLVDNAQFKFGQVLKPEDHSQWNEWVDAAKKWYVTAWKGFSIDKMTAATLLFEGNAADVALHQKKIYAIAAQFGGINGGEDAGRRGYFLTYMIAYIRDFGFNHWFMAESFETSVPWCNVLELCQKVKDKVIATCKEQGVVHAPFVSCRVTQTYDTGAAVYFYFGFVYKGLPDPLKVYNEIENMARDEIIRCGGSLSHHHGVGKLRKRWMSTTVSPVGMEALTGIKKTLDPNNIFANGNLL
eukprot:TRINITY_DN2456_c1_g2_i1.p1 TRINITY_DN2456_c1_g2~~TRINITY_DN2456_c1_g2_i1.p1  ORF type:complete len:623 (+),score=238.65 TRINITY_DN2456_c1_g2_i1:97-1965(+)